MSTATRSGRRNTSTEFNTLFETVVAVAKQVDPVKLNQTLTATAQALGGMGNRFGESIENGNAILADVNPLLPRVAEDTQDLADLADVYTVPVRQTYSTGWRARWTTAGTLNDEQR